MKNIFLFLTLSLFTMGAFSQVKFGIKVGVNNTFPSYKVNTDGLIKPKTSGFGSAYGFFVDMPISESLVFQSEILANFRYYNAVSTIEQTETGFSSKTEDFNYHKMGYVEIPLLLKYNIRLKTASRYGSDNYFGLYLGPTLAFKIADKHEYTRTTTVTVLDQKTVTTADFVGNDPNFQSLDLSIAIGGMLDFEKGLRLGLRFVRSISTATSEDFNINYNFLQFSVGYNFIKD